MARLYLKFEQAVLKEIEVGEGGVVTIGRVPDNALQIDNPAVSGHHAKIYWDNDHFALEDNNSLNGTYVNNHRISKAVLKDNDSILVGKHVVLFKDVQHIVIPEKTVEKTQPLVPTLDATVVLDTKKAKDMIAHSASAGEHGAAAVAPAKERLAMLTVMSGKTDQNQYVLSSKLNVIGKSEMASIKLRGWFKPKVAAVINHREHKYFIAASEKDVKVKVNDNVISGQYELQEGDVVEVSKVKMTFAFVD